MIENVAPCLQDTSASTKIEETDHFKIRLTILCCQNSDVIVSPLKFTVYQLKYVSMSQLGNPDALWQV